MQATTTSQMEERQPLLQSSPDRTSSKSLRSSRPPRSRTQSSRSVTSPLSPNAPSSSANAVVPTAPPEASLTHHIFRFLGYFVSFTPVMLSVALSVGILAGAKRIIVGASFGGAKASEKRGVFANTGYGAIDTPSGSTENLAAGRSSVSSARGGSGDDPTPIGSRRGPGSSHSSMYTNVTTLGSTTVDGKTLQISKFSIVRTPEETFDSVRTEWGYRYHYFKVAGVRVGFVDEGRGNKVVVCVHGATTWGYLYRKVVPKLVEQGLRVVVIDLPG
ncbi:hypothetical protein BC832DRAFT_420417 [Gaertneriomyces semiglobifer]|nr:hypothetical protein BC832DRAFT_420417 [Gaertneriomyces semiglobifer]